MLKKLLERAKEMIDYHEEVKIKVKPLKTTLARISFKFKTITLDPVVFRLTEKELLYVLLHELAHLKARTPYHTRSFCDTLKKALSTEEVKQYALDVLQKLGEEKKTLDK